MSSNESTSTTQSNVKTDLTSSTGETVVKPMFSQALKPNTSTSAQEQAQAAMRYAHRDTEEFVELEHQLNAATTVLVPEGVTFKGTIETNGKAGVYVKGEVIGNIVAGDQPIYVSEGARVVGLVQCDADIYVAGTVSNGNATSEPLCVKTPQRFVLAATGRVDGDVAYGAIRIYGGVVSGRMLPNDKTVR